MGKHYQTLWRIRERIVTTDPLTLFASCLKSDIEIDTTVGNDNGN